MSAIQFEWSIYILMLGCCFMTGVLILMQEEDGRYL